MAQCPPGPTGSSRSAPNTSVVAASPDASAGPPLLAVEVFGVPRLLLGAARTDAAGATLGALAADLAVRCPALAGPVLDLAAGWLRPGYVFVVDGRFTRDPATPLSPASEVLLVASVAGGAR